MPASTKSHPSAQCLISSLTILLTLSSNTKWSATKPLTTLHLPPDLVPPYLWINLAFAKILLLMALSDSLVIAPASKMAPYPEIWLCQTLHAPVLLATLPRLIDHVSAVYPLHPMILHSYLVHQSKLALVFKVANVLMWQMLPPKLGHTTALAEAPRLTWLFPILL